MAIIQLNVIHVHLDLTNQVSSTIKMMFVDTVSVVRLGVGPSSTPANISSLFIHKASL